MPLGERNAMERNTGVTSKTCFAVGIKNGKGKKKANTSKAKGKGQERGGQIHQLKKKRGEGTSGNGLS